MNVTARKSVSAASWLTCRIASHVCAMPLTSIIETMRPLPFEAFPGAPDFVAGLAVIRGVPTPVVSMRALMGEPPGPAGRFVTVRIRERVAALAVDEVLGVLQLNTARTTDLPPLLRNVAGNTISAVTSRDADLMLFFETARIFPPGTIEALTGEHAAG
jgi:purine-binding chemotaxis protein CheW